VGGTMGSPRSEPQVGIEPTPVRLQGGRSAELSFKGVSPRRGIRTPNLLFVREALSAVELPAGGVICDEKDAPARFERAHGGFEAHCSGSTELRGD
jgi:hypothetical protein